MKRLLSHRATQSLVVAVIAVVLALGGTALATSGGGSSTDTSAVAAKKKKPSRVVRRYVTRYVKHHPGPRGRRGLAGDDGAQGPQGAQGAQGPAGQNGTGQVSRVLSKGVKLGTGDQSETLDFATCPAGQVATGGGYAVGDLNDNGEIRPDQNVQVFSSAGNGDTWVVEAKNYGNGTGDNANAFVLTEAVCSPGQTDPAVKASAVVPRVRGR